MEDAEVIVIETRPKRPFISFEELELEINKDFPWSSRFVKFLTKIHSHWAVCLAYFLGPYELVVITLGAIDVCRLVVPWVVEKIWSLAKRGFNYVWGLAGDSVKVFAVQFLKRTGVVIGVAAALYLVWAFFKTGAYSKLLSPLCDWLGF